MKPPTSEFREGYRLGRFGWQWQGYQGLDDLVLGRSSRSLLRKVGFVFGREAAVREYGMAGIRAPLPRPEPRFRSRRLEQLRALL